MTDPQDRLEERLRTFVLRRTEDASGVSGVGDVAEGVVFSDGTTVLRWNRAGRSTAVYDSLERMENIHGHDGRTQVVFRAALRQSQDIEAAALDAAWAAVEAALPLAGWLDLIDGRWVIPSSGWSIDIRRVESGDGYFEPVVEGFWATARLDAYPRPFALRGDVGPTPADALRSLAEQLRAALAPKAEEAPK